MKMKKIVMLLVLPLLVACNQNTSQKPESSSTSSTSEKASTPEESTPNVADKFQVTFDLNYTNAPQASVVSVDKGGKVTKPSDPTRTGYTFDGWYLDTGLTNQYDFDNTVTASFTLYAGWLDSSITYHTITLHYNYDNIVKNYKIEDGEKLTQPEVVRDGYAIEDWYTDEALTARAIFGMKVRNDLDLYAKWLKTTVMEAEYNPNLWEMSGPGFSGAASDKSMVVRDDANYPMGASNGYYVSYLYSKGLTFEFDFTVNKAATATLIARWSAEMKDFSIDGDSYQVSVNGVNISYDKISFTNVPGMGAQQKHKFDDYKLNTINLVEGENKIVLTTNNDFPMGATATAAAPLVDCLKLAATDDVVIDYEEDKNLIVGR